MVGFESMVMQLGFLEGIFTSTMELMYTIARIFPAEFMHVYTTIWMLGIIWPTLILSLMGYTFRTYPNIGIYKLKQEWDSRAIMLFSLTAVLMTAAHTAGRFYYITPYQNMEMLFDSFNVVLPAMFGLPSAWGCHLAVILMDIIVGGGGFGVWAIVGPGINAMVGYLSWKFIGHDPALTKTSTWVRYVLLMIICLMFKGPGWGWIGAFFYGAPLDIRYYINAPVENITVFFGGIISPFALKAIFPIVERWGLYWKMIPGWYTEAPLNSDDYQPVPD